MDGGACGELEDGGDEVATAEVAVAGGGSAGRYIGHDLLEGIGTVEVEEVEGNFGIFHPECYLLGFGEGEEHAVTGLEAGAIHEACFEFFGGGGHFDCVGVTAYGECLDGECGLRCCGELIVGIGGEEVLEGIFHGYAGGCCYGGVWCEGIGARGE